MLITPLINLYTKNKKKLLNSSPLRDSLRAFLFLNKKHIDKKLIWWYLYCQVLTTERNNVFTNKTSCSALPQADNATMII